MSVVRIPLHAQNGSVRAYALADLEDAERLSQFRWGPVGPRDRRYTYAGRTAPRRRIDPDSPKIFMHRDLLGLAPGDRTLDGDHLNGDTLDNRRANLLAVPHRLNQQNQRKQSGRLSQYRGVTKSRSAWIAQAKLNQRNVYIGSYRTEEEAADARVQWEREHMPHARPVAPKRLTLAEQELLPIVATPTRNSSLRKSTNLADVIELADGIGIPLYARDGSVRAYAIVDAEDAPSLYQWRWCVQASGAYGDIWYAIRSITVNGKTDHRPMHRDILDLPHGRVPEVDHKDRDSLNNRRRNLRAVTSHVNALNRRHCQPLQIEEAR